MSSKRSEHDGISVLSSKLQFHRPATASSIRDFSNLPDNLQQPIGNKILPHLTKHELDTPRNTSTRPSSSYINRESKEFVIKTLIFYYATYNAPPN